MSKKVIILSMSCNQERYINEENAIRQTWGKDILEGKYDNIELLFYRGGASITHLENNVLYCPTGDEVYNTYKKSIECFKWLVENREFDYIIRTNTSTYINIDAILQFLDFNIDENIMCGPSLVMNKGSNYIPFLSGHYLIFSKKVINTLLKNEHDYDGIDDVIFSYSLIKEYGRDYVEKYIMEIDNINDMSKSYMDNISTSYCVRVKDEVNLDNNIPKMIGLYFIYKNIKTQIKPPHGFTKIYTPYGQIPIDT